MTFVNVYGETFEDIDRNRRIEHNDKIMKDVVHTVNCFDSSLSNINSELIGIQNRIEDTIEYDIRKLKDLTSKVYTTLGEYEGGQKNGRNKKL